jgi:hypothetical protein
MARDDRYYTSIDADLSNKVDDAISLTLICDFYEELENDDDIDADRKWASMSDMKEIRDGFNAFYKLTPKDDEYLD